GGHGRRHAEQAVQDRAGQHATAASCVGQSDLLARGSRGMGSNTPMENSQDIERRLLDLEVKASFADDLLEQLNQIIV
ncbi:SlyX family protein, partial [Campylobacter lari]|nr:SlyX family protein [Campylobacter lari]